MSVKDLKDAEKIALKELREKVPKVSRALDTGKATKTLREYKTRKGMDVYELKVVEMMKVKAKEKELEIPNITIVTIDKKTGEKKISISG